jgi:hypothetical protein
MYYTYFMSEHRNIFVFYQRHQHDNVAYDIMLACIEFERATTRPSTMSMFFVLVAFSLRVFKSWHVIKTSRMNQKYVLAIHCILSYGYDDDPNQWDCSILNNTVKIRLTASKHYRREKPLWFSVLFVCLLTCLRSKILAFSSDVSIVRTHIIVL